MDLLIGMEGQEKERGKRRRGAREGEGQEKETLSLPSSFQLCRQTKSCSSWR